MKQKLLDRFDAAGFRDIGEQSAFLRPPHPGRLP